MRTYFAFCDPSGGSGSDSFTLAVAHLSLLKKHAILDGHWERKPFFSPDAVCEEFAGILKNYKITTVTGNRYSAQWVVERFSAHGIRYVASEKTKSEIFNEFVAHLNSGRVKMPANKRLRVQFESLERRSSRTGRDIVDHAVGGHDDVANSVAGACCLALGQATAFEPWMLGITTGHPALDGPALSRPNSNSMLGGGPQRGDVEIDADGFSWHRL